MTGDSNWRAVPGWYKKCISTNVMLKLDFYDTENYKHADWTFYVPSHDGNADDLTC